MRPMAARPALSERLAGLRWAGMERADSITIDPQKWFFQAYDIGGLLVRDGALLEARSSPTGPSTTAAPVTHSARPTRTPSSSTTTG